MPPKFWGESTLTAIYLINQMPTQVLNGFSPYYLLFTQQPNYQFLRVFGYACYLWIRPYTSSKLEPRSVRCIFLGYSASAKGYRCFDPNSGKVYTSRHVQFHEDDFPFERKLHSVIPSCPDKPLLGLDPHSLFSKQPLPSYPNLQQSHLSSNFFFKPHTTDEQLLSSFTLQPFDSMMTKGSTMH